jgi:hypothetical protein
MLRTRERERFKLINKKPIKRSRIVKVLKTIIDEMEKDWEKQKPEGAKILF